MKIKSMIIMSVFILFLIPFASSEVMTLGIFKQNTCVDLLQTCANCTYVNITNVVYPNSSSTVIGEAMSTLDDTRFNYTFCSTEAIGKYIVNGFADVDGLKTIFAYDFDINYSGDRLSTSQGLLYVIFLIISLGVFLLTLYGSIKIKWKHTRNEDGKIIGLNELKYVKLVLITVTYLLSIWISFLIMGVSRNYLYIDAVTNLFNVVFWVLISGFFPIFVVTLAVFVINFVNDKKIHKALMRGLPVR